MIRKQCSFLSWVSGFLVSLGIDHESCSPRVACEFEFLCMVWDALCQFAAVPTKRRRGSHFPFTTETGGKIEILCTLWLCTNGSLGGILYRQTRDAVCQS